MVICLEGGFTRFWDTFFRYPVHRDQLFNIITIITAICHRRIHSMKRATGF